MGESSACRWHLTLGDLAEVTYSVEVERSPQVELLEEEEEPAKKKRPVRWEENQEGRGPQSQEKRVSGRKERPAMTGQDED